MDGDVVEAQGVSSEYVVAQDFVPDLRWNDVIDGLLALEETSVLYGPSNCGKSALLGLAASKIVSGQDFFGSRTRPGMVVHVAPESPTSVLERSVAYRAQLEGLETSPYLVRKGSVDLFEPASVDKLIQELHREERLRDEKIVLVIFDTLARSCGAANENDSSHMTRIAEHGELIAKSLKAHCLFVHHTGKDEDRGSRGSSALRGAVDTEIALIPNKDSPGVVIRQPKQRTHAMGQPAQFRTVPFVLGEDEYGEPRTTVMAVPMEEPAPVETSGGAGRYDRRSAVLTALHLLQSVKGDGPVDLTTRELVDALPPVMLSGIADADGRAKAVNRILGEFAKMPGSRLSGAPAGGWKLAARPTAEMAA